jgi:hypothetical protein
MVFLKRFFLIMMCLLIPMSLFAFDETDSQKREKLESLNTPLVPIVDENQSEPEPPTPPIDNPMQIPEIKQKRDVDRLINPHEIGIPLVEEQLADPSNVPIPVHSPGPNR